MEAIIKINDDWERGDCENCQFSYREYWEDEFGLDWEDCCIFNYINGCNLEVSENKEK